MKTDPIIKRAQNDEKLEKSKLKTVLIAFTCKYVLIYIRFDNFYHWYLSNTFFLLDAPEV